MRVLQKALTFDDVLLVPTRSSIASRRDVDTGTRLRLGGLGEPGVGGGPAGDLYLTVRVRPHPVFEREGDNLRCEVTVGFPTAALGGEAQVPTVRGTTVQMRIPAGTQGGQVFRLAGQGMPRRSGSGNGDLMARVNIRVPRKLDAHQRELIEQLAGELSEESGRYAEAAAR